MSSQLNIIINNNVQGYIHDCHQTLTICVQVWLCQLLNTLTPGICLTALIIEVSTLQGVLLVCHYSQLTDLHFICTFLINLFAFHTSYTLILH